MRVSRAVLRKSRLLFATLGVLAALGACSSGPLPVAPQRIAVEARPNGIAIRPSDGALFITDDATNSVLASVGGQPFARFAALPAVSGQQGGLSQLVFVDADTLMVERFGFGTASAVFELTGAGAGAPTPLTGLDPARRRLGLASIGHGQLLSTWFVKTGNAPQQGGLSLLTYDAATHTTQERDLMSGFGKPVGVAVQGDTVYVSDQANNRIVKASLSVLLNSPAAVTANATVAKIDSPDLLAIDANGTLYTKCNKTGLCTVAPDGVVGVLADDFQNARGVAVDAAHHTLYAVDRATSATGTSYIRSFPLR
jgi:DNA-binding beta-propeller fold protein YncE